MFATSGRTSPYIWRGTPLQFKVVYKPEIKLFEGNVINLVMFTQKFLEMSFGHTPVFYGPSRKPVLILSFIF